MFVVELSLGLNVLPRTEEGGVQTRGGLTIWKLGHCPRARDAPGTFFIGFFEFGEGHRGPMIPYCPG
ncbi:unnamed protein product, partial [Staurois parvus]